MAWRTTASRLPARCQGTEDDSVGDDVRWRFGLAGILEGVTAGIVRFGDRLVRFRSVNRGAGLHEDLPAGQLPGGGWRRPCGFKHPE